jgi:hypothetical protein
LQKLAQLLHGDWHDQVAREGVEPVPLVMPAGDSDDLPCPACGTAAPLVEGACSDCGLQLE